MNPNSEFWKQKPVFITGATGLLGSTLTKYLVDAGADVVVLVRDEVPQSRFIELGLAEKVTTVHGDLTDYSLLQRVMHEYEIDTVFHLAAQTIVGTAERGPLGTFETNIRGTYFLLEACRQNPLLKRVVVASSDKAYGEQKDLPYNEETPLQGRSPYDVSKSCADLLCSSYYFTYNLPVCVTRCGNFFGPGDLNYSRIIPGTIRSLHQDKAPVIRSNGQYVRDYIFVDDGALAYIELAEKMLEKNLAGQAFNFSYGLKMTVLDVVNAVAKAMDKSQLKPKILNEAGKEIPQQYLSSEKAKEILGWKPTFNFEQGLKETIRWYISKWKHQKN